MKVRAILFFLFIPVLALAQMDVYVSVIGGRYVMSDMKKFQHDNEVQSSATPAPLKKEMSFPVSLQAETGMNFTVTDGFKIGWFGNYTVTKGQEGYADYSGSVRNTQKLNRFALGSRFTKMLPGGFELYGKLGLDYSRLELDYAANISGNTPSLQTLNFHSYGALAEPGLDWSHGLGNFFVRANIGYEVNVSGKTLLNGSDAWLLTDDNKKVYMNWSGLRAGLALGFNIH